VSGYGAATLTPRFRSPNITLLSLDQGSTIVCALRWFPIPPRFSPTPEAPEVSEERADVQRAGQRTRHTDPVVHASGWGHGSKVNIG